MFDVIFVLLCLVGGVAVLIYRNREIEKFEAELRRRFNCDHRRVQGITTIRRGLPPTMTWRCESCGGAVSEPSGELKGHLHSLERN